MDTYSYFKPISIYADNKLSIPFLVDWILAVIICILIPFYFGRIFGWLITKVLNLWIWRKHRIKITIQSIKMSFLGGRVFFKNLTVITGDYTVSFLEGSFTWRYWLFRVRPSELELTENNGNLEDSLKSQTRFLLKCDGFEAFVYNKLDKYQSIFKEHFTNTNCGQQVSKSSNYDETTFSSSSFLSQASSPMTEKTNTETKLPLLYKIFPIGIEINKGAIVLGNRSTKKVGIASFDMGSGSIDLASPGSDLDIVKKKISIDLMDCVFEIKNNLGYMNDEPVKSFVVERRLKQYFNCLQLFCVRTIGRFFGKNKILDEYDSYLESWQGLDIYHRARNGTLFQNNTKVEKLNNIEYAKYSTIMKSERMNVTYFYDVPGVIPEDESIIDQSCANICGKDPEFGVEISLYSTTIYYGPWAHGYLRALQEIFSPVLSHSNSTIKIPKQGDTRNLAAFTLTITVIEDSMLHIPIRERSKDLAFFKHFEETGNEQRPFGWLNVSLNQDSELSFTTNFFPLNGKFSNELTLKLMRPEIKSSVNHDILFKASEHLLIADLSYPLGWNDMVTWNFNFSSKNAQTFILRDHVTFISDLISDFTSIQDVDYELFRPFHYNMNWSIDSYKIFLTVNDANIINNPLDFGENCYICMGGEYLNVDFKLPSTTIAKRYQLFEFEIGSPCTRVYLYPPSWNTLHEFMKELEIGHLSDFKILGTYISYDAIDIDNMDSITLDIRSSCTVLTTFGFVLRYFMNVKHNYFGDFKHFKTTEEYTNDIKKKKSKTTDSSNSFTSSFVKESPSASSDFLEQNTTEHLDPDILHPSIIKRTFNETDIWITFCTDKGCIALPQNIYNANSSILLLFDSLTFDIRYTNYYMDLSASFPPIYVKESQNFHSGSFDIEQAYQYPTSAFVVDLSIHAHRMFGLPPTEDTFFCKWDISASEIEISAKFNFLLALFESFIKIGFTYTDLENILLYDIEKTEDITTLSVAVDRVLISISDHCSANLLCVEFSNTTFDMQDLATEQFSKRIDVKIPAIVVSHKNESDTILSKVTSSIDFTNFIVNKNAKKHKEKQRQAVLLNDSLLHRCSFLIPMHYRKFPCYEVLYGTIIPSISIPVLCEPLTSSTFDSIYEELLGPFSADLRFDTDIENASNLVYGTEFSDTPRSIQAQFSLGTVVKDRNENLKYNNIILNIGSTNIRVTPDSLLVMLNVIKEISDISIEDTLDMCEMSVVKKFGKYDTDTSSERNLSLFVGEVKLDYGRSHSFQASFPDETYLSACISNLSLYMRDQNTCSSYESEISAKFNEKETVMSLHIQNLDVEFTKEEPKLLTQQTPFARINVVELDGNMYSAMNKNSALSANKTTISIDQDEFNFLSIHMQKLFDPLVQLYESISKRNAELSRRSKEILLCIAKGGKTYNVNHVPPVITKPAYITRLSSNHVRENQSWRLITRLRHALNYFPDVWFEEMIQAHASFVIDELKVAEEIRNIFSDWKSWEVADIENCYFYRSTILGEEMISTSYFYKEAKLSVDELKIELISPSSSTLSALNVELGIKNFSPDAILDFEILGERKTELNVQLSADSIISQIDENFFCSLNTLGVHSGIEQSTVTIPSINFVGLHVKHLSLTLTISKMSMNLLLVDVLITTLRTTLEEDSLCSVTYEIKGIKLKLFHLGELFFSISSRMLDGNYQKIYSNLLEYCIINLEELLCETANCEVHQLKNILDEAFCISDKIKPICARFQSNIINNTEQNVENSQRTFSLLVALFRFRTALFYPYVLQLTLTDLRTILKTSSPNEISVQIGDILLEIMRLKFLITRCIVVSPSLKYLEIEHTRALNAEVESCKLSIFDFKPYLSNILQDADQISKSLDAISDFLSVTKTKSKYKTLLKQWSFSFIGSYFGFLLQFGSSKYVAELTTLIANITKINNLEGSSGHFGVTGSFSVRNFLFLITDITIPLDLSKVVDLGFSINISRGDKKASLELESSHTRICLSPPTFVKLLTLFNEMKRIENEIKIKSGKPNLRNGFDISSETSWDSIHILSHDFCAGWIFGVECSAPGLVFGFGSLFGAYEHPYGKITLVDGFFSSAVGKSSNSFYPLKYKIPDYNRSHLPNMQLSYWFEETVRKKDLFIKINASQLDIKLLTNVVDIAKGFLESIDLLQDLKHVIRKVAETETPQKKTYTLPSFITDLGEVNCSINYGGGVMKLYTQDDILNEKIASFQLTSPMIKVSVKYAHTSSSKKPHWLRGSINVESTHNTIFPTCVPILFSLKHDVKALMKNISLRRKKTSKDLSEYSEDSAGIIPSSFNYNNMFDLLDLAFVINVGNQNVTLSCEPSAKIQADLGYKNFKICVFTNIDDSNKPLSLALTLSGLEISSRHIFSREISGSASITSMDINLMLTEDGYIKTFGNTLFSGLFVYLNLKQMQDINLLLDIWSHKGSSTDAHQTFSSASSSLSLSVTPKPLKLNNIPWVHHLVLKNISAKIDMGPSLGILTISTPMIWAISDHAMNWTHSLEFNLEEFQAVSEGRFGVNFILEKAVFMSVIRWPIKQARYDIPIINLSLNVETLSSIISFDYHSFLIGKISKLALTTCNERDSTGFLKDLLRISLSCGSIDIFLTALAAANLYDIYDTFSRMKFENRKTYAQILKDSNPESSGKVENKVNDFMKQSHLRTSLAGKVGSLRIHLYPSTLFDQEVLVLTATHTSFDASTQTDVKTKTDLSWQIHDINVALAKFKNEITEESFVGMGVDEYIVKASNVTGGVILAAPSIFVAITTWQRIPDSTVELLYSSSFGGKVDIKWNLDPINFIREMWAVHVRALSVRRGQAGVKLSKKFFEDENIEDKIKIVDLGTKYKYVPLEEPHIEMPLLKDLGDATPPIEWFGVNRKRFPGMTHQVIVVPLQKLILAADKKYNKKLGRP